jgi:hypothetical protein
MRGITLHHPPYLLRLEPHTERPIDGGFDIDRKCTRVTGDSVICGTHRSGQISSRRNVVFWPNFQYGLLAESPTCLWPILQHVLSQPPSIFPLSPSLHLFISPSIVLGSHPDTSHTAVPHSDGSLLCWRRESMSVCITSLPPDLFCAVLLCGEMVVGLS